MDTENRTCFYDVNRRYPKDLLQQYQKKIEDLQEESWESFLDSDYVAVLEAELLEFENSVNKLKYKTIGLSRKIKDDPEMLTMVNLAVEKCKSLELNNNSSGKSNSHGHNHSH